jgi:SAM-dependent methyltransferase
MDFLLIVVLAIVLCFSFVVIFGAPYVPTLKSQRKYALKMLALKPGQTLVELGCGDGTILILAAQQGIKSVGYELNPILVLIAKFRTRKHSKKIKIVWGNFWSADISQADGIYVFLIQRLMAKLEKKILNEGQPNLKVLSYTFQFPNLVAIKSDQALYLYQLPSARQKTPK